MATFGDTSSYTDWQTNLDDVKWVSGPFTLNEAGDVSKLTCYVRNTDTGHGACAVKGVIYANTGTAPAALLGTSNELAVADNKAAGWVDLTFASVVSLSAGTYFLGFIGNAAADGLAFSFAAGTPECDFSTDTYSDGPTNPFGDPDIGEFTGYTASIYATYTAAGAATVPVHLLKTRILAKGVIQSG